MTSEVAFALHLVLAMRSLLLLLAVAGVAGWIAVRHLPAGEAQAALARPAMVAPEHESRRVESVAIDGRGLPLAVLRDMLTTRRGDLLDTQRLATDRAALEHALRQRGYLAAHVAPADVSTSTSGAYVTFPITQGAMFKVRTVTVTGASERDAGVVTLSAGDDAIASRIDHARQLLADHLARRGKRVEVVATVTTDVEAAAIDVELATR